MNHHISFVVSVVIVAIAVTLLASSEEAEGGGTGSWPYVAGNWDVLFDTTVWDETITVDGDVMVHPVGSLILDNVTLEVRGPGGINILSSWVFIQNGSDLTCDVINGQDSAVCRIWDTDVRPYTTAVEFRFWEVDHWVDINQSSLESTYGQFQESSEVQLRNSTFTGFPTGLSGALFKFYESAHVNVTDSQFTNLSEDTLFTFYQEDANITDTTFLNCDMIYQVTNGTVTFTDNIISHFLTVEVVDAFLQPVAGARIVVFDSFDATVSDRTSNASGIVEWIVCEEVEGVTEQNPHLIVVSRLENYAEVEVEVTQSQTVRVRLREYEQKVQVAVLMVNTWTKSKLELGDLMCYLNQPADTPLSDDYLCFDWDNYIYYPVTYVNVSVYDHFDRLVWYRNESADYSEDRMEFVAYINFTTIKIRQYEEKTNEPVDLVQEFNLTLEGSDISYHFEGDEVGVVEVDEGNNNYTLAWAATANHTNGEVEIREVSAQREYPPSSREHKTTGYMLADISVRSMAKKSSTEQSLMARIAAFFEKVEVRAILGVAGLLFLVAAIWKFKTMQKYVKRGEEGLQEITTMKIKARKKTARGRWR